LANPCPGSATSLVLALLSLLLCTPPPVIAASASITRILDPSSLLPSSLHPLTRAGRRNVFCALVREEPKDGSGEAGEGREGDVRRTEEEAARAENVGLRLVDD